MPASMMHLYAARLFDPKAPLLFYIGNVAPDCVNGKQAKDQTHLRGEPKRAEKLCEMAAKLDRNEPFQKGVLLHLYLDYLWDNDALREFIEDWGADDWFLPYREQLSRAGLTLYASLDWARQLWLDMEQEASVEYAVLPQFPAREIQAFLQRNGNWHRRTQPEPSAVFLPERVEHFSQLAAKGFTLWLSRDCKTLP